MNASRPTKIFSLIYLLSFLTLCAVRCSTDSPPEHKGSDSGTTGQKSTPTVSKSKAPPIKGADATPSPPKDPLEPPAENEDPTPQAPATGTDTSSTPKDDPILALHQPMPTACAPCHESKRLTPDHYKGQDCVSCHKYPSFKGGAFAHDPKPATCEGCHSHPTTVGVRAYPNQGPPANFNPNDPTTPGSGHYRGKDCSSCHQTPKEGATAFAYTHTGPNPQACLPCHFNEGQRRHRNNGNVMLTGFGNCQTCHSNFARPNRNFDPN